MSCHDGVIPKMDLGAWKTASPHFVIPETLLEESVVRAKREAEDYLTLEETLQLTAGKCYLETCVKAPRRHCFVKQQTKKKKKNYNNNDETQTNRMVNTK